MKKKFALLALVGCMLVNVGCYATDFDSIVPENLTHEELLKAYIELKSAYDELKGASAESETLSVGGYIVGEDALTEGKYDIVAKSGYTIVNVYKSYDDYAREQFSFFASYDLAPQALIDELTGTYGDAFAGMYAPVAKNARISNGNYIFIESGEAEFVKSN